MKTVKARIGHSKEISDLMLYDLRNPNPKFSSEMINNFREHAKDENIKKEFSNPQLILFLAVSQNKVVGFIVGYEEKDDSAMIHYISAKNDDVRKILFDRFVKECQAKNIRKIIADSFEFMDNNNFFKSSGFKLTKKEKITENLEMLWYELNLV